MNVRLLILAALTAVILALFMSVSAPGQEPQAAYFRMTLGGDCSADRATGDLYHPLDPYCIVAQGSAGPVTWSIAPNGPGATAGDEGLNPQLDEQPLAPVDHSAPAQTSIQGKQQDKDNSNPAAGEQSNNQPGTDADPVANMEEPTSIPNVQPGESAGEQGNAGPGIKIDEPAAPQGKDSSKDQPEEEIKTQVDKDPADRNDEAAKKQAKDKAPAGKECKKAGRDNANSQGKHDCSADRPDTHSGQERTTDHNQHSNSNDRIEDQPRSQHNDPQSSDKECKKAERDNANSQGNHDCSADRPDTHSDQQRTTDHNPSAQAHSDDPGKDEEKKD